MLFAGGLMALLLFMVGVPLLMVVLMSLRTGFPGEGGPLTLANFIAVYSAPGTYKVLLNTLLFASGTVLVALVFAVPLVWLLTRTDLPLKGTIYVLMTVGILIPVFLRTIAWILLLSPRIGLVNQWATQLFGLDHPLISLYNIPGMAFIQGVSFVPSAFFMLAAAYRTMDPSLEEAAYTAGVSKFQTFLRINVPITLPAIAGVMVYLFMSAIAVFEVPAIIGFPARILVLSALIFTSTNPPAGLPDYGLAGAYGAVMLVAGLSLLVSWLVVRTQVSFRGSLDTIAFLPHAIPSILLAVGLGYLGLAYRNFFPVYGTIAIIAIAHTITWIAYGTRTTNGVMIQVHRELEEAGKVSGASTPRVLGRIVLPLVAAGIFNSWIWISMLSYREVTMALALGTRKNLVVSTIVWQFGGNGWVPQVAALGVVLVVFAVLVGVCLNIGCARLGV